MDGYPLGEFVHMQDKGIGEKMFKLLKLTVAVLAAWILVIAPQSVNAAGFGCKGVIFKEKGDRYKVVVRYPAITDQMYTAGTRSVVNELLKTFVHKMYENDLNNIVSDIKTLPEEVLKQVRAPSAIDVRYKIIRMDENIISVKFEKYVYRIGYAHGSTYVTGFNYDVKNARMLALKDIFTPKTDYLKQISDYSTTDLEGRLDRLGDEWIRNGASPKEENYANFSIDVSNINIYFQQYQVSEYASGVQTVRIPFGELSGVLRWFQGLTPVFLN